MRLAVRPYEGLYECAFLIATEAGLQQMAQVVGTAQRMYGDAWLTSRPINFPYDGEQVTAFLGQLRFGGVSLADRC
jgi:hypothetical protein